MNLHNPMVIAIAKGAVSGAAAAAVVDLHAFATWKSFNDVAQYDWKTAAFRWFQGAVTGAVTGAGFGVIA